MRARTLLGAIVAAGMLLTLPIEPRSAEAADRRTQLIETLEHDKAYKVRMKAMRLLADSAQPDAMDVRTRTVIEKAALHDPHHLVRGLACFLLGKHKVGEKTLLLAHKDPHAFVRAHAEDAVAQFAPTVSDDFVATIDPMPGVKVPQVLLQKAREMLANLVPKDNRVSGYALSGRIAQRTVDSEESGTRVTFVVRFIVATYPRQSMRHAVSARATALSSSAAAADIEALEVAVLEAAVGQAVRDAMAEI